MVFRYRFLMTSDASDEFPCFEIINCWKNWNGWKIRNSSEIILWNEICQHLRNCKHFLQVERWDLHKYFPHNGIKLNLLPANSLKIIKHLTCHISMSPTPSSSLSSTSSSSSLSPLSSSSSSSSRQHASGGDNGTEKTDHPDKKERWVTSWAANDNHWRSHVMYGPDTTEVSTS